MKKIITPIRQAYLSITCLRVLLGLFFLWDGYQKLMDPMFATRLPSLLESWAANNPVFFYQDILNGILAPHGGFWASVVTWMELLIGGCYVLGVLMPIAIATQIFLNLNFLLATLHVHMSHIHQSELILNTTFIVLGLVLLGSSSGKNYGLDEWVWPLIVREKKPKRKRTKASTVSEKASDKAASKEKPKQKDSKTAARKAKQTEKLEKEKFWQKKPTRSTDEKPTQKKLTDKAASKSTSTNSTSTIDKMRDKIDETFINSKGYEDYTIFDEEDEEAVDFEALERIAKELELKRQQRKEERQRQQNG